ncbi:hypothetical protein GCM10010910_15790 [Microbacterium nanhaiense]|uniref:Uncharacterized protein n=1 Tax=Microbacterium nanhaiense TaxID=1301026 RepID=A0ABQ2MZX8_9MICO|nr:hypothetical protein GCM10010910_15790 [Microbacterium nanhaiense]
MPPPPGRWLGPGGRDPHRGYRGIAAERRRHRAADPEKAADPENSKPAKAAGPLPNHHRMRDALLHDLDRSGVAIDEHGLATQP